MQMALVHVLCSSTKSELVSRWRCDIHPEGLGNVPSVTAVLCTALITCVALKIMGVFWVIEPHKKMKYNCTPPTTVILFCSQQLRSRTAWYLSSLCLQTTLEVTVLNLPKVGVPETTEYLLHQGTVVPPSGHFF